MMFKKKPVIIEARQINSLDYDEMCEIVSWSGAIALGEFSSPYVMAIPTLEGQMMAQPGDWIIQGVQGEFYPCKPDIFEATYEPV